MAKPYPKFENDEEHEAFLDEHSDKNGILDLSQYDLSGKPMSEFPQWEQLFKDKSMSLRLPRSQFDAIVRASKAYNMPVQRFIRQAIEEKLEKTNVS